MPNASVAKTISGTSPTTAAGAGVVGNVQYGLAQFDAVTFVAELAGATGGTLDVQLQSSWDGGTTWYDIVHFAQLADGASAKIYKASPALSNDIATIGKNTTPLLAAATCAGGHWGDQVRTYCVPGATTTAGAAVTIKVLGAYSRR